MNKILSLIRTISPLAILIFAIVLLFVPLPVIIIEFLMIIDWGISLAILITVIIKKKFSKLFYTLVLFFSLVTIGIEIATSRYFLTIDSLEEQIAIVRILGELICAGHSVGGIFIVIVFELEHLSFFKFFVSNIADRVFQNFSDSVLRQAYYALSFFNVTLKAFIVLLVIDFTGGVAEGIINRNMFWKDAVSEYAMLSCGYIMIFLIPLSLVCISFYLHIRKLKRKDF